MIFKTIRAALFGQDGSGGGSNSHVLFYVRAITEGFIFPLRPKRTCDRVFCILSPCK